ncbi:hypothetical protein [Streptomyces geranii]|uniref:hypothetical protein n=1 Tax=Streptomyces geranii TaxID=2058923 RepID=UPI0013008CEF|nr:hypothetical protein [Streptomyces geranii]
MTGSGLPTPRRPETTQLLTNDETLKVHRRNRDNREVLNERNPASWTMIDTDAHTLRLATPFTSGVGGQAGPARSMCREVTGW